MNISSIRYTLGRIMRVESFLLLVPMLVALYYREGTYLAFLIPAALLLLLGSLMSLKKPNNHALYSKEGLFIVAIAWIVFSIFGALPYVISGEIPSFIDSFFETVSGFTTTGASILTNVEALSRGMLFWRSFTNWIGGMGVLVFVLAVLPKFDVGAIHLFRAESPGPVVDKIVSKLHFTARILYGIYVVLTALEIIMLLVGGMPFFDSIVVSFSTMATGGFSVYNLSIAAYHSLYSEIIIMIFMLFGGINFTLFYLIVIGNVGQIFKSTEFRWYISIIFLAIVAVTFNILSTYSNVAEALRYSSFQVISIITTTGFSTIDYNNWPVFTQIIIMLLMVIGSSAGSTAGGLKISRLIVLLKSSWFEIRKAIHPHLVASVKSEGKTLDRSMIQSVNSYFMLYVFVFVIALLLLSLNGFDFLTTFSAVVTCFNNVGPGLGLVGPLFNFSIFSDFSKLVLSLTMLAGRLELYPILIMFSASFWRKH